jgi:glycosyltransferase involved in cell wall biosynthesis
LSTPSASMVSVVIPTYNRAHLVGRAIRSVLQQTHQRLEILVVDDASSDGTEEIVRGFRDDRIRYLRHDSNRGGSAARNTGIRAATGEYLAFLDSDDEWLPDKLRKQLALFATTADDRLGLVVCGWRDLRGARERVTLPTPGAWTWERFLGLGCVPHGTPILLLRLSVFPELPLFDERLPANQDWEFVLRLVKECAVAGVAEPLVNVFREDGIHIGTLANRVRARLLILEKHRSQLERHPKALSLHHFRLAHYLDRSGDKRLAYKHIWRAIKANPRDGRLYSWLGRALTRSLIPRGLPRRRSSIPDEEWLS